MNRLLAAVLLVMSFHAFADDLIEFQDGDVIRAEDFNHNFQELEAAIDSVGGAASPELVTAEQGNDPYSVTALCPSGKKVTGGGCRFNQVNTDQRLQYCEYIDSYPLNDLSGYGCVTDPTDSGGDRCQVIRAYAICQ